jgi:hypothetical protein
MRILTIFVKDLFGFPAEGLESRQNDSKHAITRSILLDTLLLSFLVLNLLVLELVGIDSIRQRFRDSDGSTPTYPRFEADTGPKQARKLGKSPAQVNAEAPDAKCRRKAVSSCAGQSQSEAA